MRLFAIAMVSGLSGEPFFTASTGRAIKPFFDELSALLESASADA